MLGLYYIPAYRRFQGIFLPKAGFTLCEVETSSAFSDVIILIQVVCALDLCGWTTSSASPQLTGTATPTNYTSGEKGRLKIIVSSVLTDLNTYESHHLPSFVDPLEHLAPQAKAFQKI